MPDRAARPSNAGDDESGRSTSVPAPHVLLKCENFQRSGAFKARGAFNAVLQVPEAEASRRCRSALVGQPRRRPRARGP